ncbi:hypothetical protein GGI11_003962 [Coemansia sp. RSA 2049]|nr:hypothetical protein GGI11_003962 [Coemansia sp. RSA 2049]
MAVRSAQNAEDYTCKKSTTGAYDAPCGGTAAKIAQSTVNAAFCNWYTTGGSIDNVLNSYGEAPANSSGVNFGSFVLGPDGDIDTTTSGKAQENYAWTNGINIWLFDNYKTQLQMPSCPNIKLNLVEHTQSPSPSPSPSPTYAPPPTHPTTVPAPPTIYTPPPPQPTSYHTPPPPLTSAYPGGKSCVRKRVCRRCHRVVKRIWASGNGGAGCKNPYTKRSQPRVNRSDIYDKISGKLKKRAPNAYMLFRLQLIKYFKGTGHKPDQINSIISRLWGNLDITAKY